MLERARMRVWGCMLVCASMRACVFEHACVACVLMCASMRVWV